MKATLANLIHDLGLTLIAGFLGSLTSLAYMPGLTFRQQLAATFAGGLTASFVSWAVTDWLHLSAAVAGGVSFVVGLVAFRATPALIKGLASTLEGIPNLINPIVQALADRIRTFGGRS